MEYLYCNMVNFRFQAFDYYLQKSIPIILNLILSLLPVPKPQTLKPQTQHSLLLRHHLVRWVFLDIHFDNSLRIFEHFPAVFAEVF